jgi:hypothetical protein
VKKVLTLSLAALLAQVGPAAAQWAPDLLRVQLVSGILMQGDFGEADLVADFTDFTEAAYTVRNNGSMDVDPSPLMGLEVTYRLKERITLGASYLHSRGHYRAQWDSQSEDGGTFDLESFLLMTLDWVAQTQGSSRPIQAMSNAMTDIYMGSVAYELPLLRRYLFPYLTAGVGLFRQQSDGTVIRFDWEGAPPAFKEQLDLVGLSVEEDGFGVPLFNVDETNFLTSFGAGARVSITKRWGAEIRIEDLIRWGVKNDGIEASTPPPDRQGGRVFSMTTRSKDGAIHNLSARIALIYAFWPFGAPR